MNNEELEEFYKSMYGCRSCSLRNECLQVVVPYGNLIDPKLIIIGDIPSIDDIKKGIPFSGNVGEILKNTLRQTKILNTSNTMLTTLIKCLPKDLKFPKKDLVATCMSKWQLKEIELLKPKRLLLLGNNVLKQLTGISGVSGNRGQWFTVSNIRSMATFHPSFIARMDNQGKMQEREFFEQDIFNIAEEIKEYI